MYRLQLYYVWIRFDSASLRRHKRPADSPTLDLRVNNRLKRSWISRLCLYSWSENAVSRTTRIPPRKDLRTTAIRSRRPTRTKPVADWTVRRPIRCRSRSYPVRGRNAAGRAAAPDSRAARWRARFAVRWIIVLSSATTTANSAICWGRWKPKTAATTCVQRGRTDSGPRSVICFGRLAITNNATKRLPSNWFAIRV